MKLFHFYRSVDESGVSGTGPVVEGVEFTNGWCALRWISDKSSVCFYQSLEQVEAVHGHGGKTEIIVHDIPPLQRRQTSDSTDRMELLLDIIEETSRVIALGEAGELERAEVRSSVKRIKRLLDRLETRLILQPRGAGENAA